MIFIIFLNVLPKKQKKPSDLIYEKKKIRLKPAKRHIYYYFL